MGRRRLPPDEMRWFATSGIIVTWDPVRDRIMALTRSMSAATRLTRLSMLARWSGPLSSNGTTTPTLTLSKLADTGGRLDDGHRGTAARGPQRAACRKGARLDR